MLNTAIINPIHLHMQALHKKARLYWQAVGHFLYGDDTRTRRSLVFSYSCIALVAIGEIYSGTSACHL